MKNLFDRLFPKRTRRRAILGTRHEPGAIAHSMDAGRIGDVLRSAEAGSMEDFFSLVRDVVAGHGHTQAEFGKRKLAVLANQFSVTAADAKSGPEVALAESMASHLDETPGFQDALLHLLDSTLYPVSVVEKIFRPSSRPGWRFELERLQPVPYRLLDFSTGQLLIRDCSADGGTLGSSHSVDPLRYIVHRGHILTSVPDTWGGPMRAVLFWWCFAVMDRDWWARFLERFGSPFLVGRYDEADLESRALLESAFNAATRLFGLAVPNDTSVDIHSVNTSQGGDAFEKFHAVANREISKIVLGQTLSAEGQNLGLGGGQASAQENVRDDIRQFDATRLASTVRTQLLAPLFRLNAWQTPVPRVAWGGEDADTMAITGDVLSSLASAGLRLTAEGIEVLSKRLALPLERMPAVPAALPFSAIPLASRPTLRRFPADRSQALRDAVDRLAAHQAAEFAGTMAATLSPLLDAVDRSTSITDLQSRILTLFPDLDHRRSAALAEACLVPPALNACLSFRDIPGPGA
jgi:phage gp29-like protein